MLQRMVELVAREEPAELVEPWVTQRLTATVATLVTQRRTEELAEPLRVEIQLSATQRPTVVLVDSAETLATQRQMVVQADSAETSATHLPLETVVLVEPQTQAAVAL